MKATICIAVIASVTVFASGAKAQNYPWCARIDLGDEVENCAFDSFEQCMASLGGGHDQCIKNNTYKPPPPESQRQRKHNVIQLHLRPHKGQG
jgi:hypothetical protein